MKSRSEVEYAVGSIAIVAGAAVAVASAFGWMHELDRALILVLAGANFVQHSNHYKDRGPGSVPGEERRCI